MKMSRHWILATVLVLALNPIQLLAQTLPTGKYHQNRERAFDLLHYAARLKPDLHGYRLEGEATVKFTPLRPLNTFELDAIGLKVTSARFEGHELSHTTAGHRLQLTMPRLLEPGSVFEVSIMYSCTPMAGMYFHPDYDDPATVYVSTWGEGGLHANWLPIYNDLNDKFTSEFWVEVPKNYTVVSNGQLLEKKAQADGSLVFHWRHDMPHPNYLLSVNIGPYVYEALGTLGKTPIGFWAPAAQVEQARYVFLDTQRMMAFFSKVLDYPYPWNKYDQIVVPGYAPGAMEHTTITGHDWAVLRDAKGPYEYYPTLNEITSDWTLDSIISHELVHHWFGDNLTARNESYIWLNESMATYMALLWTEERFGEDALNYYVGLARQHYLDYANATGNIRPLEYPYFDNRDAIFDIPITYLKGAAILHNLRTQLGKDAFLRVLAHYLKRHAFGNVISSDLRIAIDDVAGRNMDVFFDQWISGGGHPKFKVSYQYYADRKLIDLSISQTQAIVPGQGLFDLSVDVTVATTGKTWTEHVRVKEASQAFLIPSESAPLMVSFDGQGALVAEVEFAKGVDELVYQVEHDPLPGKLWALQQLARSHRAEPKTLACFKQVLGGKGFWGLRANAAQWLGTIGTSEAEELAIQSLADSDYHVRKGAVLGLPGFGTTSASAALEQVIAKDVQDDVVATAIIALSQAKPDLASASLASWMERSSWHDEIKVGCLTAMGNLARPEFLAAVKSHADWRKHNQWVVLAALQAWETIDAADPELHRALIAALETPVVTVKGTAIARLGSLAISAAKPALQTIVDSAADSNMEVAAQAALAQIERLEAARTH